MTGVALDQLGQHLNTEVTVTGHIAEVCVLRDHNSRPYAIATLSDHTGGPVTDVLLLPDVWATCEHLVVANAYLRLTADVCRRHVTDYFLHASSITTA